MKTAIYIEDGIVQLVITPETEFEKNALTAGSFYDCRGGWIRQKEHYPYYGNASNNNDDNSLILVARETTYDPKP